MVNNGCIDGARAVSKMKQTEIGLIPEDWEVKSIRDIATIFGRIGFRGYTVKDIVEEGQGAISISPSNIKDGKMNFINNTYISWFKYEESPEIKIFNGDILLVKTGSTVGKTALVKGLKQEATLNPQVVVFKKLKINNDFLSYIVLDSKIQNQIVSNVVGGAIPTLSQELVYSFQIPLPPLPEQEAIASALSDADAWIESLAQLIAKKRLIKQGAMQELLTPPDGTVSGVEPWEVKKLGEVCEIIMGQSPLSAHYNQIGNGLPLVQGNADIDNRRTIIRNYTSQITKRGKVGDIIMSVRAPVGEIAISTFECCLGRGVCAIRAKNDYLYHYLIYSEKNWGQFSTGSTFDSVNSNQVNDFSIALPKSLSEQTRIATILSDMDAELEALEQQLAKARQIKQGMMQELLTGRIRL